VLELIGRKALGAWCEQRLQLSRNYGLCRRNSANVGTWFVLFRIRNVYGDFVPRLKLLGRSKLTSLNE
jgi:hypothetical protein